MTTPSSKPAAARAARAAIAAAALLAAGLAAAGAHAEGLYAGGALGRGHWQDPVEGVAPNDGGLAGKAYGGWQFTPNFALEGGYAMFGHIDDASGKVRGQAVYADAVGRLPFADRWALLGSIGVASGELSTPSGDEHGVGPKVGAGLEYALTPSTSLRGQWERYHLPTFDDQPDIDQYTFGVNFGF